MIWVVTGDYMNEAYAPTASIWAPTYISSYIQSFTIATLPPNQGGGGQTPAQAYVTASQYAKGNGRSK